MKAITSLMSWSLSVDFHDGMKPLLPTAAPPSVITVYKKLSGRNSI